MIQKVSLIAVLVIGLILRLYKIDSPLADWHSHRQADTASVTRNLSQNLENFFTPTYHDLSNLQSGQENPQGYRMVELPLYNLFSLITVKITGQSLEISSRLTSILFSLGSSFIIFLIVRRLTNLFWPSLLSTAVFLFLPFSIYYSRAILPENVAVFFMLLCLYFFPKNLIVAGITLGLSFLVKPFTGFIVFPALIYLTLSHRPPLLKLFIFFVLAILPFFFWRQHISHFPQGIPASAWLFNNSDKPIFPEWYRGYNLTFINHLVAFRPSWFNWLFNIRINQLILGSFGLVPFIVGFAYRHRQVKITNFSLFLGTMFYFIIVAQGNIQHDYYQILIIPQIAISTGLGLYYLRQHSFFLFLIPVTIGLVISWSQIKNYYHINNQNIIKAGQIANQLLPQDAIVVAPYNGDTSFLYQINRSGYPIDIYDLDSIKNLHPNNPLFLVSVNFDDYTNKIIKSNTVIIQNKDFVIVKL
ncbi:MAG: glycosyltransferase family 39 protein [Candidatus Shapirobacteria bacterium]|jgi:4-amino-4-deoxy-L-arabinose transferase-like glycosyltransferase